MRVVHILLLALLIDGLLEIAALYHTSFSEILRDTSLDWTIRMHAGVAPTYPGRALPFTVLDIDDQTYYEWKEPPALPRDRVLGLIRFAVDRGASAIIVDIDLGTRLEPDDADRQLLSYLHERANQQPLAHSPQFRRALPPLIFIRSFRARPGAALEARPSVIDSVLSSDSATYIAAPLFEKEADLMIRRWRLWQPTCGHPHQAVVPSVQLLLVALHAQESGIPIDLGILQSTLAESACSFSVAPRQSTLDQSQTIHLGSVVLHVDQHSLQRRIFFTTPWHVTSTTSRPVLSGPDHGPVPALIDLPARTVLDAPATVSSDAILNRVVVIGGSFAEGRDIHSTPLGPMPGTYVIVNAVNSLIQYGELREPPFLPRKAYEFLLLFVAAIIGAALPSLGSALLWAFLFITIMLPATFWLFRSAIWLDFSLPLLAVPLHHLLSIAAPIARRAASAIRFR
jgi:CHASE2 domain-containing sensor protein